MSEIGDNQVPYQCIGKGQQGIKPLPLLSFSLNFPSLRLGEMLAQYLNDPDFGRGAHFLEPSFVRPKPFRFGGGAK